VIFCGNTGPNAPIGKINTEIYVKEITREDINWIGDLTAGVCAPLT